MEELFKSPWKEKIQEKLPKLFRIAEIECSRAGKIGMEVGSTREKVLVALLICVYGEKSVDTNIPITKSEVDVIVRGEPISIKTVTKNNYIKACWTVDQDSAIYFAKEYKPSSSILLVKTFWGETKPSFFYIPIKAQQEILNKMGTEKYLALPKPGTNPRGVEFSADAINFLENHTNTSRMVVNWKRQDVEFDVYTRWIEYWIK